MRIIGNPIVSAGANYEQLFTELHGSGSEPSPSNFKYVELATLNADERGTYNAPENTAYDEVIVDTFDVDSFLSGEMENVELSVSTFRPRAFYHYDTLKSFKDTELISIGEESFARCPNLVSFIGLALMVL